MSFYDVYQIWFKLRLKYNSLNDVQDFEAKNLLRAAENTQTKINTTYHRHKHVLTLYYHYPQLTMIDKQNRLNDIKNTNMLLHTDTKPSFTHPNSHTHLMRASHHINLW